MPISVEIAGLATSIAEAISGKLAQTMASVDGTAISVVAGGKRGPALNALIANVQAGRKRSPWYIKKGSDSAQAIRFASRGFTSSDYATRKRAADQVGSLMLEAVAKNVEAQRNPDGSGFRALTPNYAAYKRRKFGFVVPILKATNDLLGGLKVRVERLR